ncbi:MAG TPA: hypothetical protein VGQ85_08690, partial [Candidatus Limnocylindrales bacterium]|nr:hypothetical protein [Candidatus Limnocylindrales bacterium]
MERVVPDHDERAEKMIPALEWDCGRLDRTQDAVESVHMEDGVNRPSSAHGHHPGELRRHRPGSLTMQSLATAFAT